MPQIPAVPWGTELLVADFFQQFDVAFATLDGAVVAERYATPYMACRADGSAEVLADPEAVASCFQRVIDGYRQLGVRSCRHHTLVISAVDSVHLPAHVTWVLDDETGRPATSWSESYLLICRDGDVLVRASIDHSTVDPPASPS